MAASGKVIYMDYAATTPVRKEVLEAMLYIVEASSSNVILRLSQLLSASVPASSADNWDVMVKSSLVLVSLCSYLNN